jgi:hypothetical protein
LNQWESIPSDLAKALLESKWDSEGLQYIREIIKEMGSSANQSNNTSDGLGHSGMICGNSIKEPEIERLYREFLDLRIKSPKLIQKL